MENATKALIIAGSILIVILLIAMGVSIFKSTSGTTDQVDSTMQTTEMAMFNNQFTMYAGKQSGSRVKALANAVIANNAKSSRKVSFNGATTSNGVLDKISSMDSLKTYNVSISDTNNDGYIDTISFS